MRVFVAGATGAAGRVLYCSNRPAQERLGFGPLFPSIRDGWLIEEAEAENRRVAVMPADGFGTRGGPFL